MQNEILLVAESVSGEKGLSQEVIFEAIESALATATKRRYPEPSIIEVTIDKTTGEYETFRIWEVVEEEEFEELEEITASSENDELEELSPLDEDELSLITDASDEQTASSPGETPLPLPDFKEGDLTPMQFQSKQLIILGGRKEQSDLLKQYLEERLGIVVEHVTKKQNLWRLMKLDTIDMLLMEWDLADENNPLEASLKEPIKVIRMMRESGVSLVSISMGNPYTNPHIGRPFDKPDDGNYSSPEHPLIGVDRQFELCAQVQRTFPDLPIVGAGYSWLQHWQLHAGAANIRDKKVTMMGIGRGALAYPNLPKDGLEKGILDVRTTCKTLTFCTYLMRQKNHPLGQYPTGCPPFDKKIYGPLIRQARSTKT